MATEQCGCEPQGEHAADCSGNHWPHDACDSARCSVCGQPACTVPGLHGMLRDRAAAAAATIAARKAAAR